MLWRSLFLFILFLPGTMLAAEEGTFDIANLRDNFSVNRFIHTADFTGQHIATFDATDTEFVKDQLIISLNGGDITGSPGFDWHSNPAESITLNSSSGLTWFYLSLENTASTSREIFLEFTQLDGVGWIDENENGDLQAYVPNYETYIGGRVVFDTDFIVPVELGANSSRQLVGFMYSVSTPRLADIRAWEPEAFRTIRTQQNFSDGAYYGFLLALVIYNLTLAFIVRQIAYLYAGVFQLCVGCIVFISTGYSTLFLLPNDQTLTVPIFSFAIMIASIASGLFSMAILQIKNHNQRLYRIWLIFVLWGVIQLPLTLLTTIPSGLEVNSNRMLLIANAIIFFLSQGLHVYTLLYFWKRVSVTKYWFVAITLQVWMLTAWQLTSNFGVDLANVFQYIVQVFTILNGAVLTWLIGFAVRKEQHYRIIAQEEAFANLQMANDIQKSKANFISTAGHDLRQPLQAIRLHIEALKESASSSTSKVLNKVENNLSELSGLLSSLMNLSKSTSYIEQDANEEFILEDVLQTLKEEMEPFALQKGLAINIQDAPFLVRSSKVGVTQIVRNLLHNSIKFTREGSVNVAAKLVENKIHVSIIDTGFGIAEEDLDKIFSEFFQVEESSEPKNGGMGIGLSIVKRLCESLSIPVEVRSKLGQGTEFELILNGERVNKEQQAAPVDPSSLSGLRVAILHGSKGRRDELKNTLEQWGVMALAWENVTSFESHRAKHEWEPHMLIVEQGALHQLSRLPTDDSSMQIGSEPAEQKIGSLGIPTIVLTESLSDKMESIEAIDASGKVQSGNGDCHWFSDPISPGVLRSFIQRVVVKPRG